MNGGRASRIVELRAGGRNDPDGAHAATLLHAYFHAEELRAFRRLVWRRLAALMALFTVAAMAIPLPSGDIYVGIAILVAIGMWAAVLEWRAEHKLHALIADLGA